MARVQLALNVKDIDEAVDFYRKVFGTEPAKRRPGYANFAIADPPLKLVLFENDAEPNTMNHVGVELESVDEVAAAAARFEAAGLPTRNQSGECCYAVQDKVWVSGPLGAAWEFYTVLADAPESAPVATESCTETSCC